MSYVRLQTGFPRSQHIFAPICFKLRESIDLDKSCYIIFYTFEMFSIAINCDDQSRCKISYIKFKKIMMTDLNKKQCFIVT